MQECILPEETKIYANRFQISICLKQDGVGGAVIACKEAEENSLRQWKHIQGYIRLAKLTELITLKVMHFIVSKL